MLDPAIARWNGIDAKAESYYHCSPYAYADNNPVNNTDPDGNTTVYGGYGAGYAMQAAVSHAYSASQNAYQVQYSNQAELVSSIMTRQEWGRLYMQPYINDMYKSIDRYRSNHQSTSGGFSLSGNFFDDFASLAGKVGGSLLRIAPVVGPSISAIEAARKGNIGSFVLNAGLAATILEL